MPLPRIMTMAFAGAAAVPVLSSLVGIGGRLPDAAGVLALLVVAAFVVLYVRPPLARWALAAGTLLLAAASVVWWLFVDDPALSGLNRDDIRRFAQQQLDSDHAGALLLLVAVAALTTGIAALPRSRRRWWLTALAGAVALTPVVVVVLDAAEGGDSPFTETESAEMWLHLGPALAATVLAGLALVLAVSRAGRWFLLPVGALLLELAAAQWTWASTGSWATARLFGARGTETSSAFLEPGLRYDVPADTSIDIDLSGALTVALLLLAPALLAAGAARIGSAGAPAGGPEPAQEA